MSAEPGRADEVCALCAAVRADDPPVRALAWVRADDGAGPYWVCPGCAWEHVRAMEGKLPTEYW